MGKTSTLKRCSELVKELLLPTSTNRFQAIDRNVKESYAIDIETLETDRDVLRYLMRSSRAKRVEALNELKRTLPPDFRAARLGREIILSQMPNDSPDRTKRFSTLFSDLQPMTTHQEELTDIYLRHMKTTRRLRKHLREVRDDLDDFKYTVNSQAVAEFTRYYRGIKDWGESMRYYFDTYATGLGTLSLAGAGLVYANIFGATRGNIGLMSFTFPLFTVGFLVPGFVYIGICWASSFPRTVAFASQRFWTAVVIIALLVATHIVVAAIIILNITIFLLDPNDPNTRRTSSLAEISGITSLAFSGSIIFVAAIALFLGLFSRKLGASLSKYRCHIHVRELNALNTYDHV
ncbi:hypothetical protein APHAL10511_005199 [Amanita phalloides]|nr:hypothetical protein APHAL10511_005199 [Amanita phalloides]